MDEGSRGKSISGKLGRLPLPHETGLPARKSMDSPSGAVMRPPTTDVQLGDGRVSQHLPDFFLLGAAKCGTTSMHHYLRQHPNLYLPAVKELDFFDATEERYRNQLDWYLEYFRDEDDSVTGEATPLYFRRTDRVPDRMLSMYGGSPPRFIVLLRDPVQRAYSHYLHKKSQGTEPLSFREALDAEVQKLEEKQYAWKSYFTDGLYADRLEEWFAVFPQSRFLVLLTDNLERSPEKTIRCTFRFLDVQPDVPIDTDARLNVTAEQTSYVLGKALSVLPSWLPSAARRWTPDSIRLVVEQWVRRQAVRSQQDRPTLDPELERSLRSQYEPHVRKLSDLIDRDLSGWLPRESAE